MKKFFALLFVVFCMFALSGCNVEYNEVLNNMSDLRINYFVGTSKDMEISLSCGYREEIFAYDGVSSSPIECGVISLMFFETHSYSSIEVALEIDGVEENIVLEKSPFEDVFMYDIQKILNNQNKIFVRLKNTSQKIELKEISNEWAVDYKLALKIASEHYGKQIRELYFNNRFNAECYLKPIYKSDFGRTFWYFSIIDKVGNNYNLLIDVNTKEIISANSANN